MKLNTRPIICSFQLITLISLLLPLTALSIAPVHPRCRFQKNCLNRHSIGSDIVINFFPQAQLIERKVNKLAQYRLHSVDPDAANTPVNDPLASQLFSPLEPPYSLSLPQKVYLFLTSVFITSLIIADVIGVKIFEYKLPFPILGFRSIEHTCGMLTFPITFLLGDIITEYYGPESTQQTVNLGFFMSVLVFFVVNIAQAMPYLDKPFNVTPAAFDMIFASAKLLYVASLSAYLIGAKTNIWLFGLIKKWTKGKHLWIRSVVSTVISQLLDSFVVSYIAFRLGKTLTNQVPATVKEILDISITGYGLKFVITGLLTPALYGLKYLMEEKFKLRSVPLNYGETSTITTN